MPVAAAVLGGSGVQEVIVEGNADVAALIAVIEEEGYTAETVA